jgi:hypothetical protein
VFIERFASFFLLFYSTGGHLKDKSSDFWRCLVVIITMTDILYVGFKHPNNFKQLLAFGNYRDLQKIIELSLQIMVVGNVTAMELYQKRIALSLRADGSLEDTAPFTYLSFSVFFSVYVISIRLLQIYFRRSKSARNYHLTRATHPDISFLTP